MNIQAYWREVCRIEETLPETVIVTGIETGEPIRAGRRQAAEGIASGLLRLATKDEGDCLRHRDEMGLAQSGAQAIAGRTGYQVRIGRRELQAQMDASPAAMAAKEKREKKV